MDELKIFLNMLKAHKDLYRHEPIHDLTITFSYDQVYSMVTALSSIIGD